MSSVNIVAVKMAQDHKVVRDTGGASQIVVQAMQMVVQAMQMVVQHHH